MRIKQLTQIAALAAVIGTIAVPTFTATTHASSPAVTATATVKSPALQTLNSFYKPALKGQFPGSVSGLTVGSSTRQDVVKQIGKPDEPAKDADSFNVYAASMGNPGYAFNYKLNKIREIRYFGTNVERQNNIGGITKQMLFDNWGKPTSSTTITAGKKKQQKVVYVRGSFQLAFIFDSATSLNHINLTKKS
ncbi:YjgB family protein [Cohnella sp. GCM10027633]|uniref:YjgB family protein n=1 Tax=unclassified Cohnella TaxID=2636738 RepID=UPI003635975B